MEKFNDMQKTTNESVDATMRSFEGATKATQAIAAEIADYTRRSFEHGSQTMENLLGAKSLDERCLRKLCESRKQVGRAVHQSGQRSIQAIPGLYLESGAAKVVARGAA
jgi:hypothetical protein